MTLPDLSLLPDIALSDDEPVFDAPWQAQAFAMAVSMTAAVASSMIRAVSRRRSPCRW